jgi:hypothetical protein
MSERAPQTYMKKVALYRVGSRIGLFSYFQEIKRLRFSCAIILDSEKENLGTSYYSKPYYSKPATAGTTS